MGKLPTNAEMRKTARKNLKKTLDSKNATPYQRQIANEILKKKFKERKIDKSLDTFGFFD